MVVPPFGAEVGMTGGENDDPMSPTRCDTTPMMEAKRPDKELLKQKLEQLSKAQGPLQLASGERVLLSWDFEAVIFDPRDKLFMALTLGLYGLFTSRGLRKRRMRMLLTDRRVLMKEEVYQKVPTIKEEMWEAQQAMNLADLTYVRLETGTGMMLEPDYFVLDLHFLAFPSTVEPSLYQSMGSVVFRPIVDTFVAAFDNATGGLISELRKATQGNLDPLALLAAIQAAQEAAAQAAGNPAGFVLTLIQEIFLEAARRFKAWLKAMYKLLLDIVLGLVPIAALAAKLWSSEAGCVDDNVMRMSLYRPDDENFLMHAENFMKQVVAQRDAILKNDGLPVPLNPNDPAIHPYKMAEQHTFEAARGVVGQKGQPLTLPSFLYAPFLHNAEVLAVTPIEPRMRALDKVYCYLSFGIYWITDLQGILHHKGATVMTNKTISTVSFKTAGMGKGGLDHARFDLWFLPNVSMHASNMKKNFFNDQNIDLTIGCRFGNIIMSVDFMTREALVHVRRKLSEAMPKTVVLPVPQQKYTLQDPQLAANLTLGMLEGSEVVISVIKCKDFMSIVAKILSLGMGEHSHTLCVMTNYRIIYRSVASNCRGERRCWEASIPISAIRSVFWSNFYHRSNKIMAIASKIPCIKNCACCCAVCPFLEDHTPHFWMGKPGMSLRLLLGNQRKFGTVMTGDMIWYCGAEDSITKSIVSITNAQYEMGAFGNGQVDHSQT